MRAYPEMFAIKIQTSLGFNLQAPDDAKFMK